MDAIYSIKNLEDLMSQAHQYFKAHKTKLKIKLKIKKK
jgi:hypothetical protein